MSQYVINIGALPNDGTGDPLRTAFNDVNLNFNQVFAAGPVLSNIQIANNTILTTNTNGNLVLAPNGIGVVQSNVNIVPNAANIRNLGSATHRWATTYTQYLNVSGTATLPNVVINGGTITIPVANLHIAGGTNGYVLQTDGDGNLTWTAQTGGSGNAVPGGSNSQVQFNDAGSFNGHPGFTFNKSTDALSLPGAVSAVGNISTAGNVLVTGVVSAVGNVRGSNFNTTGAVSATGAMFASTITLSSTGTAVNASSGNILTNKVTGTQFAFLNGIYTATLTGSGATANYTLNLPANAGSNGQILTSDGTGNLIWESGTTSNTFSAITMTDTPSGASDQIKYGLGNLVVWNDGGWTIGEYNGTDYGTEGIRINPGIEGSADIVLPADPANVPVQVNNYSGNVRIQTGEGFNWTFDSDGEINLPANSNSFGTGHIQSANGYPTLLAYGSGDEHGGPELDWMNTDDPGNAFMSNTVLRNTMYINDNGLYIGINENGVANVASNSWRFTPDGNLVLPGGGNITNQANTSLDPTTPTASTLVLTPDANYNSQALVLDPTSIGHIHLRSPAGANIDLPYANIFLGGELSSFEVGASYGDAPPAFVHSNGNTWTFGTNGTLTLAGDITADPVGFPFTSSITNITTGIPTVVVDVADNIFGAPVTGKVLIQGVVGTTEANETWYYQAVEANQFQLFEDAACTVAVDGTSWTAYVNGGTAYASAYDSMAISTGGLQVVAGPSSWYFGMDGNLNIPGDLTIGPAPGGGGSIVQPNAPLQVVGEGANAFLITGWAETTSAPGNVAVIGFNAPYGPGAGPGTVGITTGNNAGTTNVWAFTPTGETVLPTLDTQRGDTTSGTISGYTLRIGDGSQEAVITTPDGTAITQDSPRLVINPGKGRDGTGGEGGDIYLWAGRGGSGDEANAVSAGSGGDIKIRGGQGGGWNGDGGYIRIEAGDASSTGGASGYIDITGGNSSVSTGGRVAITGGRGVTTGGDANITGGYGSGGNGGNVNIFGGSSSLGAGHFGNVIINTGNTGNTWTFDQYGNLLIPNNTTIYTPNGTGGAGGANINIQAGAADQTDFYATPGGNVNIVGGLGASNDGGGGGPGGSVNITAGNSSDPSGHAGNVNLTAGVNVWTFDYASNLTLAPVQYVPGVGEAAALRGTRKVIGGIGLALPYSTVLATGGTPTVAYTSTAGTSSVKITFAVQSNGAGYQWEQFDVVAVPSQDLAGTVNFTVSNRVKGASTIADTVVTATMSGGQIVISLTLDAAQTAGGLSSFDAIEFGLMSD